MKTTETNNTHTKSIDELSGREIAKLINKEDERIFKAIGEKCDNIGDGIELYAETYRSGHKIVSIGAGSSGRYGVLDSVELVPTYNANKSQLYGIICGGDKAMFGSIEGAEDHPEYAVEDLKKIGLEKGDLVIGIAASGDTPYTLGAINYAKEIGAKTISICCNENSAMSKAADISIDPEVGPEVINGSTRMKSGTTAKMVLNMLSTGAMIRCGRVYENYMVYVQPRNIKLVNRMKHMIMGILDVSEDKAAEIYEASGHVVAVGLVMYWCNVTREEAIDALDKCGGFVRKAVAKLNSK